MLTVVDYLIYLRFKCWVIILTPKYAGRHHFQQTESMLFIIHHVALCILPMVFPYTHGHGVLSGNI